jgi:response regulator RpfG family c-di-GMP phosphodiesterase
MAAVYADLQGLPAGGGAAVAVRDSERVGDPHHEASPGRPLALVVEPDPALRQEIAGALRTHGMGVVEAEDGLDALLELSHRAPDLVVLDMTSPRSPGTACSACCAVPPRRATRRW